MGGAVKDVRVLDGSGLTGVRNGLMIDPDPGVGRGLVKEVEMEAVGGGRMEDVNVRFGAGRDEQAAQSATTASRATRYVRTPLRTFLPLV